MPAYRYKPIPLPFVAAGLPPDRSRTYFEDIGTLAFTSKVDRFNLVNAWWLAEAAFAAYETYDPTLRAAIPGFKEIDLKSVGNAGYASTAVFRGNSQFLAIESREVLIVAFRGTRLEPTSLPSLPNTKLFVPHWGDVVTDAKFLPQVFDDDKSIFVHQGFYQAFADIKDDLSLIVERTLEDGRPVWFCGHSLGAALATLAADAYRGRIEGLCTFGSPRVGNAVFVERLAQAQPNLWRFVHHRDAVTMVPPATSRGYAHVGEVMYLDGGEKNWQIQAGGAAKNTLGALAADAMAHVKQIAGVFSNGFSPVNPGTWPVTWDGLSDHAPIYYTNKIFNALVDEIQRST